MKKNWNLLKKIWNFTDLSKNAWIKVLFIIAISVGLIETHKYFDLPVLFNLDHIKFIFVIYIVGMITLIISEMQEKRKEFKKLNLNLEKLQE